MAADRSDNPAFVEQKKRLKTKGHGRQKQDRCQKCVRVHCEIDGRKAHLSVMTGSTTELDHPKIRSGNADSSGVEDCVTEVPVVT